MTNPEYNFTLSESQIKKLEAWKQTLPPLPNIFVCVLYSPYEFTFKRSGFANIVKVTRMDNPKEHELNLTETNFSFKP